MRVTVRKIAEEHNVSPATVSLVLNDKPGVRDDTRRRITAALVSNGYQIKRKDQKRKIQYICYQSSGWFAERPDGFYTYVLEGLDRGCKRYNAALNVTYANSGNLQKLINLSVTEGSDGIIFLGTEYSHEAIPEFLEYEVPIVVVDNPIFESRINSIYPDDYVGIHETVRYLKGLGHTDIGFITIEGTFGELYNREQIWRNVMHNNGLEVVEDHVLHLEPSMTDARRQIYAYIESEKQMPTAFMSVNDVIAASVVSSMTQRGIRVPEDVSIIGYDDSSICGITTPTLSSIRSDVAAMGEMAVRRLLELIANENEPPMKQMLATRLILRDSIAEARK